jgi:DNA-directed RNA polymerase subunit RPC12/RpoP
MYTKYRCKDCNARLHFSGLEEKKLICKNCNSVFSIDQFGRQLLLKDILKRDEN